MKGPRIHSYSKALEFFLLYHSNNISLNYLLSLYDFFNWIFEIKDIFVLIKKGETEKQKEKEKSSIISLHLLLQKINALWYIYLVLWKLNLKVSKIEERRRALNKFDWIWWDEN